MCKCINVVLLQVFALGGVNFGVICVCVCVCVPTRAC